MDYGSLPEDAGFCSHPRLPRRGTLAWLEEGIGAVRDFIIILSSSRKIFGGTDCHGVAAGGCRRVDSLYILCAILHYDDTRHYGPILQEHL
jgi:hypothetical protein